MHLVFGFRDDGCQPYSAAAHVKNRLYGGPIYRSAFMFLRNSFA
jgi:hypothetical protein